MSFACPAEHSPSDKLQPLKSFGPKICRLRFRAPKESDVGTANLFPAAFFAYP